MWNLFIRKVQEKVGKGGGKEAGMRRSQARAPYAVRPQPLQGSSGGSVLTPQNCLIQWQEPGCLRHELRALCGCGGGKTFTGIPSFPLTETSGCWLLEMKVHRTWERKTGNMIREGWSTDHISCSLPATLLYSALLTEASLVSSIS